MRILWAGLVGLFILGGATVASGRVNLNSPNGTNFQIEETLGGELTGPAEFGSWPRLCVRACVNCDTPCAPGDIYNRGGAAAIAEMNGRQFAMSGQVLAGLTVQRRVFVPNAGQANANGFVRYLDSLTNHLAVPVTVAVRLGTPALGGNILANGATTVWRTSTDDAELSAEDRWIVLDDGNANGGSGAVAALMHGAGARPPLTRIGQRFPDPNQAGSVAWEFRNVVINPNMTANFLTFVVREGVRVAAIDEMQNLVRVNSGDALFGLTISQRQNIVNFDVDPANGSPVANAGGPYNSTEGAIVQLDAGGSSDPEGQVLQYAWDFDEDGQYDDAAGRNAFVQFDVSGLYTLRVRVTDPTGKVDVDSARVNIQNVAPQIIGINVVSPINEGGSTTVDVNFADPGQDNHTFDVDWDGDGTYDELGLPNPQFDHQYVRDGFYVGRVRINDGESQTVGNFQIEVRNLAPRIVGVVVPPRTLEGSHFNVEIVALDAGGDPITYAYDLDNDGGFEITQQLNITETSFGDNGLYTINVRACDDQGACNSESVDVNVDNSPPVIVQVLNNGPIFEGSPVRIDITAVDPGTDVLDYAFDLDNDGAYDILDHPNAFLDHIFTQQGTYTVGVRARDDDNGFDVSSTQVEVLNAPPVVQLIAPGAVNEGERFVMRAVATDPGDDELSYDWDLDGDGVYDLLNQGNEQANSFGQPGEYTVRVRVNDGDGGVAEAVAIVNVGNVAPDLEVIVDSPQAEGNEVMITARAIDPGNEALVFSFDFDGDDVADLPGVVGVRDGEAWVAAASHTYVDQGEFLIKVLVQDNNSVIVGQTILTVENVSPSLVISTNSPVDEGGMLILTAEVSDPGDDTITLHWDTDGDGEANSQTEVNGAEGLEQIVIPADNAEFNVTVWARDEDGGNTPQSLPVVIRNVAPEFQEIPVIPPAVEGQAYTLQLPVSDPGGENDPLIFSLQNPPGGMNIDPQTGRIDWTPTYDQFLASPIIIFAQVTDDDEGEGQAQFTIEVRPRDEDRDGLPDTYESFTCDANGVCLDPTDPTDGAADPDGDGQTNVEEWERGTDPFLFDGPEMPILVAPIDGVRVDTNRPELEILVGENLLGLPLTIEFELFADADLASSIFTSDPVEAEAEEPLIWAVPGGVLLEDSTFWWRARAKSGEAYSDWTFAWRARVNAFNSPPTTPTPRAPDHGSVVDTNRPVLEVLPSTDPDGDALRYVFRIYREDGVVEESGAGQVLDSHVRFEVPSDLNDDRTFSWTVVAVDEANAESDPSEEWVFTVNTDQDAPSVPQIDYPAEKGELVPSHQPDFVASGSVDNDGDQIFYVFRIRLRDGVEYVADSGEIPVDSDAVAHWTPDVMLAEDTHYTLEVHATDGEAQSASISTVEFFVSATDSPPSVPVLRSPKDTVEVKLEEAIVIWEKSIDPEETMVTFVVEYCDSADQCTSSPPQENSGLNLVTKVIPGETYTWTVTAFDEGGQTSGPSETWTFTIETEGGGDDGDDGCGCRTDNGGTPATGVLMLFVLLGLRRRRSSACSPHTTIR